MNIDKLSEVFVKSDATVEAFMEALRENVNVLSVTKSVKHNAILYEVMAICAGSKVVEMYCYPYQSRVWFCM